MIPAEKHTGTGIPSVEERVSQIITQLTGEIVSRLHPKSIILIGSLGRGEASMGKNNGKPELLSDCDVIVISNRYVSMNTAKKLSSELTQKTGAEVGISGIEASLYFKLSKIFPKIWTPTIDNYDMKYGSRVVYGENYLERMPDFKPEDIPVWEGIRLMLNRMIESLKDFSIDYLEANPGEQEAQKLFPQINKVILACQDALLLLLKRYHHSYKIRNEMFQEIFPKYFSQLGEQLPQFLSLTLKATKYKLKPDELYAENILDHWFNTARICDKVFRYIISSDMGITFNNYPEFQEKYLRHTYIKKRYYRGLTPFPAYQNLRSVAKMLVYAGQLPRARSLTKFWVPWTHIIYSTIPLIYFGLSRTGEINQASLSRAGESLSLFQKKPRETNSFKEWEYIKRQALYLRDTICY